jgi:hypothetical protein
VSFYRQAFLLPPQHTRTHTHTQKPSLLPCLPPLGHKIEQNPPFTHKILPEAGKSVRRVTHQLNSLLIVIAANLSAPDDLSKRTEASPPTGPTCHRLVRRVRESERRTAEVGRRPGRLQGRPRAAPTYQKARRASLPTAKSSNLPSLIPGHRYPSYFLLRLPQPVFPATSSSKLVSKSSNARPLTLQGHLSAPPSGATHLSLRIEPVPNCKVAPIATPEHSPYLRVLMPTPRGTE